jgi:CDP-6-deoxy-D-xylo-4-hexulose-3-dehydrase
MSKKVLSMGEECKNFEEKFSKKQERKYSVFVSSGSGANLLLIQALLNLGRIKKGDKIGISSLTWATNVMPIIQLGLVPVLIDSEIVNLNVSKNKLIKTFEENKDMKTIFITNVLGLCADIQKIKEFCKENEITLLEDNCESLGSKVNGKLLGNFGMASTFSFFVGHHISTIEGGMVCTDDEELYNMLIISRAHGWNRNLNEIKKTELREEFKVKKFYDKYTFYDLAFNLRPTEISGIIGNIQIEYWDKIVKKRHDNFIKFQEAIKQNKDIIKLEVEGMEIISNFAFPLIFKNNEKFKIYKELFKKENIEVRPIIAGDIGDQPFFKKYIKEESHNENSNKIHNNGFYFGNNPEMTQEEIEKICKILKQ